MAKASTAETGLIQEGKKAPAFTLKDQTGETHKLSEYAGSWVVLYFYPKDNTPGCTTQACGFRDSYAGLKKLGTQVLGVSPDDAKAHKKFVEKYGLPFPLLVDPDSKVAEKYGAWREKNMYGKKSMGIQRSTFIIDGKGKVAKLWKRVKVEGHDEHVIAALKEILADDAS